MDTGAPKARQAISPSVSQLCRIEMIDFRVRQQYLRYRKDTVERAPNSPPSTFLSEIVQYWTAIYPELTHHQKVQSTLKPILPQGSDHLSEDVPGCLTNARKRLGTEKWCPFWS
jgi:hypothetical protein